MIFDKLLANHPQVTRGLHSCALLGKWKQKRHRETAATVTTTMKKRNQTKWFRKHSVNSEHCDLSQNIWSVRASFSCRLRKFNDSQTASTFRSTNGAKNWKRKWTCWASKLNNSSIHRSDLQFWPFLMRKSFDHLMMVRVSDASNHQIAQSVNMS